MTTPELPPLPYRDAEPHDRERILLARIAEAKEQRNQWAGLCVRLEARIADLEAENASLRQHLRVAAGDILRLASTREALTNQLDALQADQDDDNA